MSQLPAVSVIIPTFRRPDGLRRAIASVLVDVGFDIEVLVIDDSPEHSAASVVAEVDEGRVRYVAMPTPTGGRPALVRNLGIEEARHEVLYFLDDDDEVMPGGLRAIVDAFASHPDVGVAFGRVTCVGPDEAIQIRYQSWFDSAGRLARRVRWSSWLTAGVIMFRGTVIINSCCAIRRDVARGLGGYDASMSVYEDVDFFTRGIRTTGHVFIDRPVLRYQTGLPSIIHDLDGDNTPIAESYRTMLDKYRDRHGTVDYRVLQVLSKTLPLGSPHRDQQRATKAFSGPHGR